MASSPKPTNTRKVVEGIFAIHKPQWDSSAAVLRTLENHFQSSSLFAPWLNLTRRNMTLSNSREKHIRNLKVKLGHGGTLDPLATGVLIVGVGKGTKCLKRFLECTKTYECVVLFGAATDSYDAVGKIVGRAPYDHVTKELVEEKLEAFRGKIMQKPSIFSALKVDGKKMYEYARAGGEVPEVVARPVEVLDMELVEWLEPGSHEFAWPGEEVDAEQKLGAKKLLGIRQEDADHSRGFKRVRSPDMEVDDHVTESESHPKKPKTKDEPAMSGALPAKEDQVLSQPDLVPDELAQSTVQVTEAVQDEPAQPIAQQLEVPQDEPSHADPVEQDSTANSLKLDIPPPKPPAARLRMTVTSGFYVRSLCHDLGLACSSLGLMSSLIRTRQGDYSLSDNVFEYSDLAKGPEVWEPKIQAHLERFMEQEGWQAEEDAGDWEEHRAELEERKKENDRDRSFQGGSRRKIEVRGKGGKRGRRGGDFYSKNMDGGRKKDQRGGERRHEGGDGGVGA